MGWTNEKHGGRKSRDKLPLKQNHSVGFENHVDQNLDVSFDKKKNKLRKNTFYLCLEVVHILQYIGRYKRQVNTHCVLHDGVRHRCICVTVQVCNVLVHVCVTCTVPVH